MNTQWVTYTGDGRLICVGRGVGYPDNSTIPSGVFVLPVEEVQDDAFNTHYVDLTDGDQPVLMQKTPIVLTTFEDEGAPGLFTGLPIPCSVQVYHNNLPIDTFVVDDGELILDFALPGRYRVVFDAGVRFNCYEVVINA